MRDSKIEWTDHTFNPWWGCTKVSRACDGCYAEAWAKRTGHNVWGHGSPRRRLSDSYWRQPLAWDREAALQGRRRVFCASMADVFEWRPDLNDLRRRLWDLIESTPHLDWLLLTKRPHLIQRLAPWKDDWPQNVWVGATVENQSAARKRIPKLLECGARVKFLSCEPLLESLNLEPWISRLDWVIAGGETGALARPSPSNWFRALRDICVSYDVPFHFKQWGDWLPEEFLAATCTGRRMREYGGDLFIRVGKKNAGRSLDGEEWNQIPTPAFSKDRESCDDKRAVLR